MDEMEEYELKPIIDNLQFADKYEWERVRLIAYCNLQKRTKKKLSPQDIIKFPWEDEKHNIILDKEITNDDINRLKERSKNISKIILNDKLKIDGK